MDEADFPEIFVRGLHICILNHPAHFARFHNTRAKQLRKRDRGEDGERQTGRWDRQRDRRSGVPEGVSLSSSAGAVSRCRQSGYKQKVFSPLTSSTGPSVGRRHRNAYSPGVTATVCHQSVRLTVLPADNASTRAQLRFIMEGGKNKKTTGMMKYTHQHWKSFNCNVRPDRMDYAGGKNSMTTSKNKCCAS